MGDRKGTSLARDADFSREKTRMVTRNERVVGADFSRPPKIFQTPFAPTLKGRSYLDAPVRRGLAMFERSNVVAPVPRGLAMLSLRP